MINGSPRTERRAAANGGEKLGGNGRTRFFLNPTAAGTPAKTPHIGRNSTGGPGRTEAGTIAGPQLDTPGRSRAIGRDIARNTGGA